MRHIETKNLKPEIIYPQKANKQTPSNEHDEVKTALEILLDIKEHKNLEGTDLIVAAREYRNVLQFLTKIYGGAL